MINREKHQRQIQQQPANTSKQFLDETDIEQINQFLNFETTDIQISGGCDVFSTKPVGADRKLYKTIDKQFDAMLESSANGQALAPDSPDTSGRALSTSINEKNELINNDFISTKRRFSTNSCPVLDQRRYSDKSGSPSFITNTPFGPLEDTASRKTFAYLIGILNSTYPDYDFSSLQPSSFQRLSLNNLFRKLESNLTSYGKNREQLIMMWEAIDQQIDLESSSVFELSDDVFQDDGSVGALWQYKWFLVNRRKKRVVFLHLQASRNTAFNFLSSRPARDRRLTIDSEDEEEYDLTYDDDYNKFAGQQNYEEVFEEDVDLDMDGCQSSTQGLGVY